MMGDKQMWTFPEMPLNPRTLKGQLVEMDGFIYRVLGVETFALPEPIHQPFALHLKREF
jgi:hypothetical protein